MVTYDDQHFPRKFDGYLSPDSSSFNDGAVQCARYRSQGDLQPVEVFHSIGISDVEVVAVVSRISEYC